METQIQSGGGGRAVAVTVDPADGTHVLVATPTGGLYQSHNSGSLWSRVNTLPEFGCYDVQFCPIDPLTVIATCIEDTKRVNGGGVWVSKDGGSTWEHPASAQVRISQKSYRRYSAYGISFMPNSSTVVVGTDSGIVVSHNLGNTWHHIVPIDNHLTNRIYSVLALSNGKIITSGENGIWMSDNGTTDWHQSNDVLDNGTLIKNALAVSPVNNNVLFFTGDQNRSLVYSLDGGMNWKDMDVTFTGFAGTNGFGRIPCVKVVMSKSRNENELDVYFSNLARLGKKTIKWTGADFDFSQAWVQVPVVHPDESDIAFSKDGKQVLYITNDGGVEHSRDNGNSWQQVGTLNNRFTALQVYDVKCVRSTDGGKDPDIYFGTQDNGNIYGSFDGGVSWPFANEGEGGNFQGPVLKPVAEDQYSMSVFDPGAGNFKRAYPHVNNVKTIDYPFVPLGIFRSNSIYAAGGNTYVAIGPDNTSTSQVFVSTDNGNANSWTDAQPTPAILQVVANYSFISGTENASIITPCMPPQVRGALPGIRTLLRIDNVFNGFDGDEALSVIGLPDKSVIGTYGVSWRPGIASFGVDPADPDFIIINDIGNNLIYITTDGGLNWVPRQDIADLITDNGKYLFHLPDSQRSSFVLSKSQVSCISFDPLNPNCILIGTAEAGVLYSSDHGENWKRIKGSEEIPNITSFSFGKGEAYVSSWGGCIWRVPL